jgi:hypothetical protein
MRPGKIASDASTGYEIASDTFRSPVVDTSTASSQTAPSATSRLVEAWPSIFLGLNEANLRRLHSISIACLKGSHHDIVENGA